MDVTGRQFDEMAGTTIGKTMGMRYADKGNSDKTTGTIVKGRRLEAEKRDSEGSTLLNSWVPTTGIYIVNDLQWDQGWEDINKRGNDKGGVN